jgi:hypothetical protein
MGVPIRAVSIDEMEMTGGRVMMMRGMYPCVLAAGLDW